MSSPSAISPSARYWSKPQKNWYVWYANSWIDEVKEGLVISSSGLAVRIQWDNAGEETLMYSDYMPWQHGVWIERAGVLWVFEAPPLICRCE